MADRRVWVLSRNRLAAYGAEGRARALESKGNTR